MADKTQSIKGASDKQLYDLLTRLGKECRVQDLIAQLKRRATPRNEFEPYYEQEVSTEAPIESLYHYGVAGMKWGRRKGTSKPTSEQKAAAKREKTLRSPSKLYRNRDKFSQDDIDTAMKRMKWERELRSLSRDEITRGAQYAEALLKYGTVAVGAYGVYKSPAGQAATKIIKKAVVGR